MYSRLDVDATESEEVPSEHGDPRSEIETSRPQCTSFRGVAIVVRWWVVCCGCCGSRRRRRRRC